MTTLKDCCCHFFEFVTQQKLHPGYRAILYYTILYYTILYYTILYYTILYYTILYYTILYYTILYLTNKEASTVLCSVVKHAGSQGRIQGGWIGWISTPHFSVKKIIRNVTLFKIENK